VTGIGIDPAATADYLDNACQSAAADLMREMAAEVDQLAAQKAAALALHQPVVCEHIPDCGCTACLENESDTPVESAWCGICQVEYTRRFDLEEAAYTVPWPCPTVRALGGDTTPAVAQSNDDGADEGADARPEYIEPGFLCEADCLCRKSQSTPPDYAEGSEL
jgi:hypothetical protein